MRDRIAAWTRTEQRPDALLSRLEGNAREEAAIYARYLDVLQTLGAEDSEGLAVWASITLERRPPPALKRLGAVTVLDADEPTPARLRALDALGKKAKSVQVVLPFDPDPGLREVFGRVGPLRDHFLGRGFVETALRPDLLRPSGLSAVESTLFRVDSHRMPKIASAGGLRILGAPQGEGLGRVVACEVKNRLDLGFAPEDLLVLVPRWDEDAEFVLDALRSWGLPVSAPGMPRPLARDPAVSALRLALSLPVEGWEAAALIRLLRHGRVRPEWSGPDRRVMAARAATTLQNGRVFRGLDSVRRAADRLSMPEASRAFLERLVDAVDEVDRPGTWGEHVERLRRLAVGLGIERPGVTEPSLDELWLALEDYQTVYTGLGGARNSMPFRAFVAAVDAIARDQVIESESPVPGSVVMSLVDDAAGARARCVLLANLVEGTFPNRSSVGSASDPDEDGSPGVSREFSREMARFLRVVGSADEELVLVYPTRNEKGEELLCSGFLDELRRRIEPSALSAVSEIQNRHDPTLAGHPELALAPGDALVRSIDLAVERRDVSALRDALGEARLRPALRGAALALDVGRQRFGRRFYTRYDGLISDPAAVAAVAGQFGPEFTFSPSQLETYIECPFKFLLKYVLGLLPADDRDELDEDYAGRGVRVHDSLELLERMRLESGGGRLDLVDVVIQTAMTVELTGGTEADPGLQEIESRRLERMLRGYVQQAAKHENRQKSPGPEPRFFEIAFGDPDQQDALPCLELGEGPRRVKLRGKIDRVDVASTAEGTLYRVIDYKTGGCPSSNDVKKYAMVQLPLYALAVERHLLGGSAARFHEMGYWKLRDDGYKAVGKLDWPSYREELVERITDHVAQLRRGRFEVRPREEDCTSHCDYALTCRIAQVRAMRKEEPGGPRR
ncbi:MAG: PD-(D/E)XK nuclease family protein [Isosphaeraceae bacterium]